MRVMSFVRGVGGRTVYMVSFQQYTGVWVCGVAHIIFLGWGEFMGA